MTLDYWMFEDKFEDVEFTDRGEAHEYKAWGLISCIQYPVDREDGNVLGVLYRTPGGVLFRRWRQIHEVNLTKVTKGEWDLAYELIMFADKAVKSSSKNKLDFDRQKNGASIH